MPQYYNFGEKIIKWIMLFYVDFQACNINNGNTSEWSHLTRGLFQGNSISSILFIDIMGHSIRENTKIRGICINNCECKIIQFADDTNLFLVFEQETIQQTIDILTIF